MLELPELLRDRRVDPRVRVAEEVHPPRARPRRGSGGRRNRRATRPRRARSARAAASRAPSSACTDARRRGGCDRATRRWRSCRGRLDSPCSWAPEQQVPRGVAARRVAPGDVERTERACRRRRTRCRPCRCRRARWRFAAARRCRSRASRPRSTCCRTRAACPSGADRRRGRGRRRRLRSSPVRSPESSRNPPRWKLLERASGRRLVAPPHAQGEIERVALAQRDRLVGRRARRACTLRSASSCRCVPVNADTAARRPWRGKNASSCVSTRAETARSPLVDPSSPGTSGGATVGSARWWT